jgi:putative endonuclease
MYFCYILFSAPINRYYIGETEHLESRLEMHNSGFFKGSFTKRARDWELYLHIGFDTRKEARRMERFIKRQRSRKFIESLKLDHVKLRAVILDQKEVAIPKLRDESSTTHEISEQVVPAFASGFGW